MAALPVLGRNKNGVEAESRFTRCPVMIGLMLLATALEILAVINPRFTPLELVKESAQVQFLRLAVPQGKTLAAEIVETLKGKAPQARQITLELGGQLDEEEIKSAFAGKKSTPAILFLSDKEAGPDEPAGVLEIETTWFAVSRQGETLVLESDERQMFAVWAGSARLLAAATRYVQSEPMAKFPVRAEMSWGESLKLGKLAGPAHGCLLADLGQPIGLCVIVLSAAGDCVYQAGQKKPADLTAQVKLSTASKIAVLGDFDGDGRVDLISWNGQLLKLAAQAGAGTFAAPKEIGQLPECLSLDCVDAGGQRPALVAGTSQGPVLLLWAAGGTLKAKPFAGETEKRANLGVGGWCAVGDFNGDGRSDVLALFTKGALLYAGEGAGQFKAPTPIARPLVLQPRAGLCGDFDADGLLDVLVAGKDGLALLSRESAARWDDVTYLTGELAYHGNANQPQIMACAPCDVNTDGRQGMALFYADRKPLLFFNRGFSCFGWARELDLDPAASLPGFAPAEEPSNDPKPAGVAAEDLKPGQAAGVIADLNGDGILDMLAVGAKEREVWAVFGHRDEGLAARTCLLILPPSARGPVTVTVRDERRIAGMYVVRPGTPAYVGRPEAGPITLSWIGADGKPVSRQVTVMDNGSRFEIKAGP